MSDPAEPEPVPRLGEQWRRDPARFASAQRWAFSGMNLTVGRSRVVHAVAWVEWIDDLSLPAPACRQGFAGHGARGEVSATRWPVTCRRCRRLRGEPADPHAPVQPALFD